MALLNNFGNLKGLSSLGGVPGLFTAQPLSPFSNPSLGGLPNNKLTQTIQSPSPILQNSRSSSLGDIVGGLAGGVAKGAAINAASQGLGSLLGSSNGIPFLGSIVSAAQGKAGAAIGSAVGSVFGPIGAFAGGILGGMLDSHGGPKIESGYATPGLDPNTLRLGEADYMNPGVNLNRGLKNPDQDKAIVDAINNKYESILSQYGIKEHDPLQLAAFTAFDPKGTANTQFDLDAFLGGNEIYHRAHNDQNFENVGRDKDSFMKAIEDSAKGVLVPALGKYGLKVDPTTGTIDASGIQNQLPNTQPQKQFGGLSSGLMAGLGSSGASSPTGNPADPSSSFTNGGNNMAVNAMPSFGGLSSLFGGQQGGTQNILPGENDGLGTGGFDLGSLISGLGGGVNNVIGALNNSGLNNFLPGIIDAQQQGQAGQKMLDWLNGQQNTMQQQGMDARNQFMNFLNNQQSSLTNMSLQARGDILNTLGRQEGTLNQWSADARNNTMNWLNGQQNLINNLYNPGTPEANLMQQEMERKDAAAGRNSQYGVRSTDLAAKLAGIKGDLNTRFATGVAGTVANANALPVNTLRDFATGTAGQMASANQLPTNVNSQFAQSAVPSVNNNLNQLASNTNSFTQGTSKGLADALNQRAARFNTLIGGFGQQSRNLQNGTSGSVAGGSGNPFQTAAGLAKFFGNTFNGINGGVIDSLTGGFGSILPGSGFNTSAPIFDQNDIGTFGSPGGTGISFGGGTGGFGSSLDQFIGGNDFPSMFDGSDFFDNGFDFSDFFE